MKVYMNDDITVKPIVYGTWGGLTAGTSVEVKGRVDLSSKLVRDNKGEEVVSTARVMLPFMAIEHSSKIEYAGKEYNIINIEVQKDFSNRYLVVNLE